MTAQIQDCVVYQDVGYAIVDRSAEMERIRGQFRKRYGRDGSFNFIEDAFSLDLDNK